MSSLTLTVADGSTITLTDFRAIVAGYTGRDPEAVQHHIDELAAIGVAPPPEVPMFYEMDPATFSTDSEFQCSIDALTSGEVEPLYVRHRGRYYLGVGSDHTDRDLEAVDICDSKRACPKPIASQVIAVDDMDSLSLDNALAECFVDAIPYQRGPLSGIRTPGEVVRLLVDRLALGEGDFVCLGGTLPLLTGQFRAGLNWEVNLQLANGIRLEHHYTMKGSKQ